MGTVRVPLVGNILTRYDGNSSQPVGYDQTFVNCYPEVITNAATGTSRTFLRKRTGVSQQASIDGATTPAIEGRGIYGWNNKLYTVLGNKLYSQSSVSSIGTSILTLTTSTGAVGFTEFSAAND